jgi:hypothetical protein
MEDAAAEQDMGRFYRVSPHLGVWLHERTGVGQRQEFTPEQGADHLKRLGGQPNAAFPENLVEDLPRGLTDVTLADTPGEDEIDTAIKAMKDSAGGDDEITIGLSRAAGPAVRAQIHNMAQKAWAEDPWVWEEAFVRGVVILLWKRKGDRADLDNYRGICLLSVLSQIVARIAAVRLSSWSETDLAVGGHFWLSTVEIHA